MSYETERADIEGRMAANWPAASSSTPVVYGNVEGDPPAVGNAWVRLSIINGQSEPASMGSPGSNRVRHVGLIALQIYVPRNSGSDRARELADAFLGIFNVAKFGSPQIRCRTGYAGATGQVGPWSIFPVYVPFERDEYNG